MTRSSPCIKISAASCVVNGAEIPASVDIDRPTDCASVAHQTTLSEAETLKSGHAAARNTLLPPYL
jgi:hypothetical protein